MALKHTYNIVITDYMGSEVVSDKAIYSADGEFTFDDLVPAAGSLEIDCSLTTANIVSFYLQSDQDVTLNLNEATSIQSISLTAGRAYFWNGDQPGANPLTPDPITKLIFTNAGLVSANVSGGFLMDQNG